MKLRHIALIALLLSCKNGDSDGNESGDTDPASKQESGGDDDDTGEPTSCDSDEGHSATGTLATNLTEVEFDSVSTTVTHKRDIDEEAPVFDARDDAFMAGMDNEGWPDTFRHLHGDRREFTWYSPNKGNGFRLDQAFAHKSVLPRVEQVKYVWASDGSSRRDAVSDHAAIVVDLATD